MRHLILSLFILLALVGCGPSDKELLDECMSVAREATTLNSEARSTIRSLRRDLNMERREKESLLREKAWLMNELSACERDYSILMKIYEAQRCK